MYIATDTNAKEVVIISKSTMTESGYFNVSGNTDGTDIFVATVGTNTFGFVITAANNLVTFNLNAKTGSRTQSGSIALGGTGTSIYVVGNYAYVTRNTTTEQLRIYSINSSTGVLTLSGSFTVPNTGGLAGALGGQDVYVSTDGNRAYMVTARSTTANQREFFVINTTTKTAPTLVGSYDETTGMNPLGVEMVQSGFRAIMVGSGGMEYQVLNLRNETAPTKCGELNETSGTILDVGSAELTTGGDNRAFAYIASSTANAEFKIIQGGPGGEFQTSGIYESQSLPLPALTADAAFNRFQATYDQQNGSLLRFKVAVVDQVTPGTCAGVVFTNKFVGPSANPATDDYFSDPSNALDVILTQQVPIANLSGYKNPGRCFRYRAYFAPSSDFLTSPKLKEVLVNYNP
jgi:hypothetical protein